MDHPQERAGIIAGLIAYFVWGLLTLYWKQLHHFDPFELIGWRFCGSAAVTAIALTLTRRWSHLRVIGRDRALARRLVFAALVLTANWTSYVWAIVHDHVLETALGYFIAPLGTMAVGVTVLHERLRPAQQVATALGAASVVVLTVSYGRIPWVALIIASTWIVYGYLKKHVPLHPLESMAAESFLVTPFAVVLVLVLARRAGSIPTTATGHEMVLVAMAGLATVVPLMLFSYSAQRVPLTIIGPMQYLVPSMNFLFGWLIYHEALTAVRVFGFALVWVALVVLAVDSARRGRQPAAVTIEEPLLG